MPSLELAEQLTRARDPQVSPSILAPAQDHANTGAADQRVLAIERGVHDRAARAAREQGRGDDQVSAARAVDVDSIIERAIGSPGNDWLSGNHLANRLVGNSGADVLLGRQGDDVLLGDSGDDIYHYRFGDGHDRIEDRGLASDRDVLRIEGFGDFRNLENDLSFSRLGNELRIEIEPGTVMGGMAGSIRIDMTNRASGVEILTLANASTVFQSVSLRSIFDQATADPARFRATGQGSSDTFLATPFFS